MTERKQLTIIVSKRQRDDINFACDKDGISVSEVIRGWIEGFNVAHADAGRERSEERKSRPLSRIDDQARIVVNVDGAQYLAFKSTLEAHNYSVSQVIRKWIDDKIAEVPGNA